MELALDSERSNMSESLYDDGGAPNPASRGVIEDVLGSDRSDVWLDPNPKPGEVEFNNASLEDVAAGRVRVEISGSRTSFSTGSGFGTGDAELDNDTVSGA